MKNMEEKEEPTCVGTMVCPETEDAESVKRTENLIKSVIKQCMHALDACVQAGMHE